MGLPLRKVERMHAPSWIDVSDRLEGLSPLPLNQCWQMLQLDFSGGFCFCFPHGHPHESLFLPPLSDLSSPYSGMGVGVDAGVDIVVSG